MSEHRFRHLLAAPTTTGPVANTASRMSSAFVACPMFAMFPATRHDQIQAIYAMAAEKTREQLAPVRLAICARGVPEFSLN